MNSGLFDKIVGVLQLSSNNNNGNLITTYTNNGTIRARLINKNAMTSMRSGVPQSEAAVEFVINTKDVPNIRGNWAFSYNNKVYRIDGVIEDTSLQRGRYSRVFATLIEEGQ
jgi:head-tail adaptor